MGYIRHNAILVTTFKREYAEIAHQKALDVFTEAFTGLVSPLAESAVNGDLSFAIFPDGSKEGWGHSDLGDTYRDVFKQWLKAQAYEDGSSPYAWVEVQYGDDNWETAIVDDSDADRRKQPPDAAGSEQAE